MRGLRWAARLADRRLNTVTAPTLPQLSELARELHARLEVVDLHTDALLWPRDLLERHAHGHVDVPRLLDGAVGVQVFSVVTKAPSSRDLSRGVSAAAPDSVTVLGLASGRPRPTRRSLLARALEQAGRLHDTAARSGGQLTVAGGGRRAPLTGVLALEGLHALEGDAGNVDLLFDSGVRLFGLVHLADNEVGGSSTGVVAHGLTAFGRLVVSRIEARGGIVDVAHASPKTIDDVLATATRPVVASHTGVQATCMAPRNLSDAQLRGIAATGGVVGVGLWPEAVGAAHPDTTVAAIRHVAGLVGVEHVALGSDFDGTVATPFDAAGWVHVTGALLRGGFTEQEVVAIMGGNARRLLEDTEIL